MRTLNRVLWGLVLAASVLFVVPPEGLAAVPAITSGAHSVPILHWGWLAAAALLPLGNVTIETLEGQLNSFKSELKGWFEKADKEQKETGAMQASTKEQITALQTQVDAIEKKMAERIGGGDPEESLGDFLKKQETLDRLMKDKRGTCVIHFDAKQLRQLEGKTAVDSSAVGRATSGVIQIERTPGIVEEARQLLSIRNALTARPTTMQVIDFVKVNSPMTAASPQQGEGHTKQENAVTFATVSERVKTLATTIPASRQVLADWGELEGFLRGSLQYYVNLAEEQQLLSGSGSGEDLNGLITQATAFSTALLPLSGSYNRIDYIGRAIQQITAAKELQPTFIVVHPTDWWSIRLTKDTQGRYILGDPMGPVSQQQLFGLTPIVTTSITSGTFLVGSGVPAAAEIRDRMEMEVEIATQHSTQFVENMITIRAEKRLALVVYRAASFIKGTFTTSP